MGELVLSTITSKLQNNVVIFSGLNTLSFESQFFYLTQNDPNIDEVQINLRNLPGSSGGETNTASNLGTGEGVFSNKVGADLQFKSLIGGDNISLSSDADEISISSLGGAGFYGITVAETDGDPTHTGINKINFNSDDFYITQNVGNTDESTINFRAVNPPDNFSYNVVVKTIILPVHQQMAVFGGIDILDLGSLILEGGLVLGV